MTTTETPAAHERTEGPFTVSRSSDGERHWFSARDAAASVTIPAKSREDAYALVNSLNRSARHFAQGVCQHPAWKWAETGESGTATCPDCKAVRPRDGNWTSAGTQADVSARLATAAPDLLAALQGLLAAIAWDHANREVEAAQAAIAKATSA